MGLPVYKRKRKSQQTREPRDAVTKRAGTGKILRFVVQKHAARQLHYDFRLEQGGVLKSWAVPKGIPKTASQKHLAVRVEDHPYAYRTFHGVIPRGNYGAGTVEIWDRGTYAAEGAKNVGESERLVKAGLRKGSLKILVRGKKMHGAYALVRFRGPKQWLLLKHKK